MNRWLACLLAGVVGAAGAEAPGDYLASATVKVTSGEGLHRVEVPFEVHRAARPDLADLRVFNGRGDALPFAFARAATVPPAPRDSVEVPLFPVQAPAKGAAAGDVSLDVRVGADGTLASLRAVPKGAQRTRIAAWVADGSAVRDPVAAVVLEWARTPGSEIAAVQVEASEDLRSWQPIASGTVLALQQDGRSLAQPRIEFPPRKLRYLRITSSTDSFALTSLRLEKVGSDHTFPSDAAGLHTVTVGGRRDMKPGEYTYDLQAAVPVSRIRLLPGEANTVMPVEIYARNEGGAWRAVAGGTFYRLERGGIEARSAPIAIPALAARYWMVRIDPKAGVPAHAPRLEAAFTPRQVVFASRGEGPFLLAFGNDRAQRADLPLPTLIPGYEKDAEYKLPMAQVGAVGAHGPREFSLADWVRGERGRKLLLWIVLVGGVAVLGFMAWRLQRKVT